MAQNNKPAEKPQEQPKQQEQAPDQAQKQADKPAEKPKAPYAHMTQEQRDAHFFENGVDEWGNAPKDVEFDAEGKEHKV